MKFNISVPMRTVQLLTYTAVAVVVNLLVVAPLAIILFNKFHAAVIPKDALIRVPFYELPTRTFHKNGDISHVYKLPEMNVYPARYDYDLSLDVVCNSAATSYAQFKVATDTLNRQYIVSCNRPWFWPSREGSITVDLSGSPSELRITGPESVLIYDTSEIILRLNMGTSIRSLMLTWYYTAIAAGYIAFYAFLTTWYTIGCVYCFYRFKSVLEVESKKYVYKDESGEFLVRVSATRPSEQVPVARPSHP